MVLSQFLQGMDKIIDYQECLLPIYRTLKHILQTENDEVTRIHAALSIETLNQKVKEMLLGEMIEPEIELRIRNVAETKKIDVKYKWMFSLLNKFMTNYYMFSYFLTMIRHNEPY